ncbi:MAG: hypothetical protein IH956_05675, partial [Chloroflexi bacterium]|nr:hypothetical protein [Chloroflexota bacterium]
MARLSRLAVSSRYGRAGLPVAGAGVAAYFFRESLQDWLMTPFGLGVLPLAVWLVALAWAATSRRSWLRRVNLWIGSLALVALSMGIMAFFEAGRGVLGEFTLDGEVALGGEVGEAIIGSTGWLGAVRLLGVFVVAVGLTAPPLAADILMSMGKMTLFAYFNLVVGIKSLSRLYKTDRRPRPAERGATSESGTRATSTGPRPSTFSRAPSTPGANVPATADPYPRRLNPSQVEGPVAALPSAALGPATTQEEPADVAGEQVRFPIAVEIELRSRTNLLLGPVGRENLACDL